MQRELTDEGQRIFDNIYSYDQIKRKKGSKVIAVEDDKAKKLTPLQQELYNIKLELCKIIANSRLVIEDCNLIIKELDTVEDYIKCDAKVAKTLHERTIERLERVLAGMPAFDNEDHIKLDLSKLTSSEIYKHCK